MNPRGPDHRKDSHGDAPIRVLTWRWVVVGSVVTILTTVVALAILLSVAGADPRLQMDAIKTGLSVAAGTGGVFALLLAVRLQWLKERAQRFTEEAAQLARAHEERLADQAELDSTERRITDLYSIAIEQLGHDKAAVRLGALYSLERLAQDHPPHRMTIVNVVCAYLRAPLDGDSHDEPSVRQAGLRILQHHLRLPPDQPDRAGEYWDDVHLDLRGAVLDHANFRHCRIRSLDMRGAVVHGQAAFVGATITGNARLCDATFMDVARFNDSTFSGLADFSAAVFEGEARFRRSGFDERTLFKKVKFKSPVFFDGAEFRAEGLFAGAIFQDAASCADVTFMGGAGFRHAVFQGRADFEGARFLAHSSFGEATFEETANFSKVTHEGDAVFGGVTFARQAVFEQAAFWGKAEFGGATFGDGAKFIDADFHGTAHFAGATVERFLSFARARFEGALRVGTIPVQRINCSGATASGEFTIPAGFRVEPDGGRGGRIVRSSQAAD